MDESIPNLQHLHELWCVCQGIYMCHMYSSSDGGRKGKGRNMERGRRSEGDIGGGGGGGERRRGGGGGGEQCGRVKG